MHYNVAFWTSVTVVKMSYYAALTDCENKSVVMFLLLQKTPTKCSTGCLECKAEQKVTLSKANAWFMPTVNSKTVMEKNA